MNYIDIATAIARTGKSDKTLRNWVKSHDKIAGAVKREGKLVMISVELLKKDYPFLHAENEPKSFQKQKEVAQLSITANTLEMHQRELQARNDEIKLLLERKSKAPIWIVIGFVCLLVALWLVFDGYRDEQQKANEEKIATLKESFKREMDGYLQGAQSQINALTYQLKTVENYISKSETSQEKVIRSLERENQRLQEKVNQMENSLPRQFHEPMK